MGGRGQDETFFGSNVGSTMAQGKPGRGIGFVIVGGVHGRGGASAKSAWGKYKGEKKEA